MQDLNDLRFFAEVVDRSGFAAAARKLGMPRSRLSRRIGLLEDRLGIKLIHRSTRRFAVTEVGREYYRHCIAMLVEAEAAQETIDRMRAVPRGVVRVSCPSSMIYFETGEMFTRFMEQYPEVEILLESTNRRIDLLREGFDMAIRVRFPPLEDSDLVIRKLADSAQCLVASPSLSKAFPRPLVPADLASLPSLGMNPTGLEHQWQLDGPDGTTATIAHRPRFATEDMMALRLAALRGIGVCQFPVFTVADDLNSGRLVELLPEWSPRAGIIHAAFPSRRGLLPSVRALLDFLAAEYAAITRAQEAAGRTRQLSAQSDS